LCKEGTGPSFGHASRSSKKKIPLLRGPAFLGYRKGVVFAPQVSEKNEKRQKRLKRGQDATFHC
jgi:hypothetical protein